MSMARKTTSVRVEQVITWFNAFAVVLAQTATIAFSVESVPVWSGTWSIALVSRASRGSQAQAVLV